MSSTTSMKPPPLAGTWPAALVSPCAPLFCSHKLNHCGDSTGLGRWSFARFQGRVASTLCVYAAYCLVRNPRNPGFIWNQQCRFFRHSKDDPDPNPRAQFADDLCRSISTRLTAGDSVILDIDHNDDVRTGNLALRLKYLGPIDGILTLHSASSPPATFNRNTARTPIDALWVSSNGGGGGSHMEDTVPLVDPKEYSNG